MSHHRQKVSDRGHLDEKLKSIFGSKKVLDVSSLRGHWHEIKDLVNPERIEYFLKETGKKICPGCADFLRHHMDRTVSVEYVDYEAAIA